MTNTPYQRKHRSQPKHRPERPHRRRRFSIIKTLLMLVGVATLLVVLMRYAIVPLLVVLPTWMGGAA